MLLSNTSLLGWLHALACLIALLAGFHALWARKGTRRHRLVGWWYVGAMAVLNLSAFFVYRFDIIPGHAPAAGTFGIFHWFAVLALASVVFAVVGAIRQRRSVAWAHVHAQAMLGSYYGLIGGLINEMFARIVPLRDLALRLSPHAANVTRTALVGEVQSGAMLAWLMLALIFFLQVMRRHRVKTETFTAGYPMRYSGGSFLVCVGLGIIAGGLWHRGQSLALFFVVSAVIGFALLVRTRRLVVPLWGTPSSRQTRFMLAAIGSEVAAFFLLGASGFFQHQPQGVIWETALGIVGVHFLIMRGSHGPLMTWLGLSVLAWLGAGRLLHLPLTITAVGDGLLKLGFGAVMIWPLLLALQSPSRVRMSDGVAPDSRKDVNVTA